MDKIDIYNDKLTPSAKEALDESLVELHNLLIEKANTLAHKENTAEKEISLRDILQAKEELFKAKLDKEKADYRKKRWMTLITLTGALYSIIGIIFYIYQNKELNLATDMGLLMAFAGVLIIFFGFTYSQFWSRRRELVKYKDELNFSDAADDFEIIKLWQIIEKSGSNLMRQQGFDANKSKSIYDILKFIANELKSEKLNMDLKLLLSIRNRILHEGITLSKHEKQKYIEISNNIISVLEEVENKARNANNV